MTDLYIAYSDAHFNKRWSYPPRHLAAHGTVPLRGARGTLLCGIRGTISQQTEREYVEKMTTEHICKKCLKVKGTLQ